MALFFVVAFLANQAKAKKAREERRRASGRAAERPSPERGADEKPAHPFDEDDEEFEMAERTRRIQEEIRRKILERMSGRQEAEAWPPAPPVPPPAPQPSAPPVPRSAPAMPPPLPRVKEEKAKRDTAPAFDWAETERQQKLAEQMRELEEQRKIAERRAKAFATAAPPVPSGAGAGTGRLMRDRIRNTVSDDLRAPGTLRRAIVLREVLGPPVGSS
ncbi:MAG: hypothetical protein LBI02_10890 [Opitutaceae bacterium]|nr:hypothetical protein [Opitutaceae bacterium]